MPDLAPWPAAQPFEEAAYLAFSQPADAKLTAQEAAAKRFRVLALAVRGATLVGEQRLFPLLALLLSCARQASP